MSADRERDHEPAAPAREGLAGAAGSEGSPFRARLLIITAAVLWSMSGLFSRLLDSPHYGLNEPLLTPLQRASGRALFAALVMLPLLRPSNITFRPMMVWTALVFTIMNTTFIAAISLGSSASAILLQYSAPLWIYLVSVFVLGDPPEKRGGVSLLFGMLGVAVLLAGGWNEGNAGVVTLGLLSGLSFGGVLLCLRALRGSSAVWVTVLNHLTAGVVLIPFILHHPTPTLAQVGVLVLFGALQMGLPYVLMAYSIRDVSPQEAATLLLLEPVLNPVWAFLIAPDRETPSVWVIAGGLCIVGALLYRYWPRGEKRGPVEAPAAG